MESKSEMITPQSRWIAFLAGLLVCAPSIATTPAPDNFAVYYAASAASKELASYDLLVLDSDIHPDLTILNDRGVTLFGYISLGEVENHRGHFEWAQEQGLLLHENQYWENSYFVDVRNLAWTQHVIEHLVPKILAKGFHGLFLDTLDNPPHLERTDNDRFAGMTSAAANLVLAIRHHYPDVPMFLNRAYELLPLVAGAIQMELGESVFADYNFETDTYQLVDPATYKQQIEMLKAATQINPELQILTLDYWDPNDLQGIRAIYAEQRKNGFIPYVATIDLDRLIPEPSP